MQADPRERESVLHDLAAEDEEVRRLAVERSAVLAPEEALPLLVERLGDPSWRVRKAAVERISASPDADATARYLLAALADGDNPGRRNAAVDALIQCGAPVVPRLVERLSTEDVDVRKFLVDVMAGIGHGSATPALVERLGSDPDANVRAASADALGAIGGEEPVRALVDCAISDGQDALVRFSALHALASLEQGIPARDLDGALADPVLRPAALGVLGYAEGDPGAADVLIKALEDRPRASREAAMRSLLQRLGGVDDSEADTLVRRVRESVDPASDLVRGAIERLAEADLPTRLVLVQFLGLLRVPAAAVPILLAGSDEALQQVSLAALQSMGGVAADAIDAVWSELDAEARREACAFFGRCEPGRTSERLIAALEDADPLVRIEAARALGAQQASKALSPLVRRLRQAKQDDMETEDEHAAVTDALIAIAGAESGDGHRAVDLLVQSLEGAPEPVRVAIARVIGAIGSSEDTDVVSLLLKDASPQVRRAAVDALQRLDPEAAAEPLHLAIGDESMEVRIAAASVLGETAGIEALLDLCRLAEDPEARVRATAVAAVGRMAEEASRGEHAAVVEQVLDAACGDEVPVALAAIEAAGAHAESLARIATLLRRPEPEVVRESVRCLGVHGDEPQLEAVIPMVAHPDWSVRAEAIEALASRGVVRALPAIHHRLDLEQDEFVRTVILRSLERLED